MDMKIDATIPARSMIIEINGKTDEALHRRAAKEGLNPSTLFNRAMQVYDTVMYAQESGLPVMLGDVSYEIK